MDVDFILQLLNSKGWIRFIGDRNVKDIKAANDYIQKILLNNKYFYIRFLKSRKPIRLLG